MKKSINYWAFPGGGDGSKDIVEFLSEAKAAGFEAVELCYGESGELSTDTDEPAARAIARKAKDIGIEIGSVATGLFWKYSLTSDDPAMRDKAKDVVRKGLHIAAWTGTDALLVVPGVVCSPISGEQVQYDVAWQRSMAAIRELAPLAESLRVHIAVENVWNGFLLSPMETARFVDEIGSDYVGVYFDVGNVLKIGLPEHWIRVLGGRVVRIHLKDFKKSVGNINGFVDLLCGDVNWPEVMAALRETGYDGPLTAEVFPYRHHPEVLIKNTSAAMDAIMGGD
jgi:L-ribulose-5-phosphate 3-epimerase